MIDFPDNPTNGDVFTALGGITWVFQDPLWVLLNSGGGGGGSDGFTFIQDTEPTATASGQTWFDTSTGDSLVWFVDVDGAQWVQFAPGGGGGGAGSDGFTFVQDTEPVGTANGQTWFDTSSGDSFIWFVDVDGGQWVQFAQVGVSGAVAPRVGGIWDRTGPQTVAAGFERVDFNQTVLNNGIVFDGTWFRVPEAGQYAITAMASIGGTAAIQIIFDGSTFIYSSPSDIAAGWGTVSGVAHLEAGAGFHVRTWSNAAGQIVQPRLEIWRIPDSLVPAPGDERPSWSVGGLTADGTVASGTVGNLTMQIPVRAGRKYRARAQWLSSTNIGAGAPEFHSFDIDVSGVGSLQALTATINGPGSWITPLSMEGEWTAAADALVTVRLTAQTPTFYVGSFNRQGRLFVDDMGAA